MPSAGDNELLVKVYATTVNRTDYHVLSGKPLIMRFFTGLFKPKLAITGTDLAGQVVTTGKAVHSLKTGDRIMGFNFLGLQSHAQYLVIRDAREVVVMSDTLSYEQAAACIEGAYYALNVIQKMNPQPGQKALVNGATGAIGSSMVQFFKHYGTDVTAVCGAENSQLVRSLGASKVIDYKSTDFTKDTGRYDFVFDAVGKSSFRKCKALLKKSGIYASTGAPNFLRVFITGLSGGKKEIFCPPKNLQACLGFINELAEKGSFKPLIDRVYPLDKIAEAFIYVAGGQKIGNVLIRMHDHANE